ncbi:MAG: hypothetical protein DCF28_03825 [Alphaproteobacteria bacterium]|nr:MAG: hypothetical protein DCF28_03825 [Alphaproteobacteria bacterium]PZO40276.1 MAG: hypothetical protein DCE92_02620 [Alphaproteobacteria bacterium]
MIAARFQVSRVGVVYLARGADEDAREKFSAFAESYRRWNAGLDHQLHVIFKGFRNSEDLIKGQEALGDLDYHALYLDDAGFDLGAYFIAAERVVHDELCFLNTASRICGPNWLAKLAANLDQPDVGMVGCTASYEAPQHPGLRNIPFPNVHLRSNAFMLRRDLFIAIRPKAPLVEKIDAHLLEHGVDNITRRIASMGLRTLLVGKNGRGYGPRMWPGSRTFRQGTQDNLLIADNQTDGYITAPVPEKRALFHLSWGDLAIRGLGVTAVRGSSDGDVLESADISGPAFNTNKASRRSRRRAPKR